MQPYLYAAVLGLIVLVVGCGGDDTQPVVVPTTSTAQETTTTTAETSAEPGDTAILVGIDNASPAAARALPDEEWLGGVRAACEEAPGLDDEQLDEFLDLFRFMETRYGGPVDSLDMLRGVVGGTLVACPEVGARLAEVAGIEVSE